MGISLDGLASGLDTTSLINSLMQVEAIPQSILKNKVTSSNSFVSALQGLNAKIASLAELAKAAAKPAALNILSASSSSDDVTATAGSAAAAGEVSFEVSKLAQKHIGVSGAVAAWPDAPPFFNIVGADNTITPVTAASGSMDDIVAAINGANVGINAVKIAAGTGAGGEQLYRIQFTASATGAAGKFDIKDAGGTSIFSRAGAAVIQQGQDAEVKLWAGTAAEQSVTSATNTFTNLVPGVDVTVKATSATPVTVSVTRDDAAVTAKAKELVTSLNDVFAYIKTRSSVSSGTSSTGAATTTAGIFTGDSTVRDAGQRIMLAVSTPVDDKSPMEIGIEITKVGDLKFDEKKFAEALAKDPALVDATLQTISSRVADAAKVASDKYDGTLTAVIKGQESLVRNLNDQITGWDDRLATRRSTLQRIYSQLEVQLSNMQSQQSWLTSQLAGLTTGSSTS
ncbi:flagellar filament capping protein FliD [Arthrobacter sp. I2-34]|uniref:Flagellar hook-associated protein 2 n=1 Tax=Arthrobacter hankyongi TaxID=2904801 RepID=A0ABS9L4N7_9MICC|nr:flagellar filament capping protein FliD [Arthrobacter hankyongi]MCG2621624.1 flagellar filament capping protein FliD [Arthrobacter hankyongi]